MPIFSLRSKPPTHRGVANTRLPRCPSSPNCVCSDAEDDAHRIAPLTLAVPANEAWAAVGGVVRGLPRAHIVTETADYIHAECQSALFGFIDDLELRLRASEGIIAVRSASRLGYSDLGVNRRRIEHLRLILINRGVVVH